MTTLPAIASPPLKHKITRLRYYVTAAFAALTGLAGFVLGVLALFLLSWLAFDILMHLVRNWALVALLCLTGMLGYLSLCFSSDLVKFLKGCRT
jgi:hypothetical protein